MKAYITSKKEIGLATLVDKPIPMPNKGEVLIKVLAVSLNQRDLRMIEGNYSFKFEWGKVLGADCCGVIAAVGENSNLHKIGEEVIINPNVNWGTDSNIPSDDYSIIGSPLDGVFQEYFVIPENRVYKKPSHLSIAEAACLPLTGLTAYRALFTKANILSNSIVFISGISGNVSQLLLKFALSMDAKVYVSSSKEVNIKKAIQLGAIDGVNYNEESIYNFTQRIKQKFDVIIDSGGGKQVNDYLLSLNHSGKIVIYGAMNGKVPAFDLFSLYYNQLSVLGTLLGNDIEFERMLDFVSNKQIKPTIDSKYPFTEMNNAFSRLRSNMHYGKIVVEL